MADQDASSMAEQINEMNEVEVSEDEEIETDEEEVVNDDSDAADEETNSDDDDDIDENDSDEEDIEDEESDETETDEDVEESDEGEEDLEDEEESESETELTLAQNRITQLTELIESQALNQLTGVKVDKKTPEKQTGEHEEAGDDNPKPLDLAEIVGDLDLTDLVESPDKLVELLGKVINLTRQQTAADFASQLPKMVNKQATSVVDMHTLVGNFYRDNKDLSEVKQVVTAVAQSVGVENPEWDMTKVLVESAKRARKMLGISEKTAKPKARKKVNRKGKKPAVPKKTKGKRKVASKKLSSMQKQINEMNSLT